ncbi:MAG TPA: hypothetical protein PKA10_12420 [Selenomonadales bacterium]|nr:hypothetical protein [Selenomonadales bacterium]
MNDTLRNDPILRAILVVFIGLLVFGFLFGFNFGGTGGGSLGGHHGATMEAGYAGGSLFGGLIAGLITFTIKILTLVLVFALIAGIIAGIRKFLSQQDGWAKTSPTMNAINQDPLLKTILIVVAGVIAFYFIMGLFNSLSFVNMGGYMYSPYYSLFALLGFLIKLLIIAFIVSVIFALVQYIKAQMLDAKPQEAARQEPTQALLAEPVGQDDENESTGEKRY